jgi:serine/threonine-protein kinase
VLLEPGDRFGRYLVEDLIGEGGMGSVYRAFDTKLQRRVALKLVRTETSHDAKLHARQQERLLREARAAAGIEHVNAIAIHDVGEIDETMYIAMELVSGRALRAYVGDPAVSIETRMRWLLDVARALSAAHARGVVHRDVKPENVMVREDGVVKVLDFGIASSGGGASAHAGDGTVRPGGATAESWSTSLSAEGRFVGTPQYMAPEQLRGGAFDARADQFSWGVMAYELLAQRAPWNVARVFTLTALAEVQGTDPTPLRQIAPQVPAGVARIVQRAMAKDPDDRFSSMAAITEALATLGAPAKGRRIALVAVAAVGAAAFGALAAGSLRTKPVATASGTAPAASSAEAPFALRTTRIRRVTFEDGCEEYPAFTPDGRSLVFDATRGHDSVLIVKSLVDGSERRLTDVRGWDSAAQVSPDGHVLFVRYEQGETGSWILDLRGSEPPRLLIRGPIGPSFSPDGSAAWGGDHHRMVRVDIATGRETRSIPTPTVRAGPQIRELPDGRVVVLYPGERGQATGLAVYSLDGEVRWLTSDPAGPEPAAREGVIWRDHLEEALAITPDGTRAVVSRDTEAGNVELFAFPIDGGAPSRESNTDFAVRSGMAFARDGRALAWSTCHAEQGPVRIDAAGKLVPLREAQRWLETAVAAVPGSRRLVVLSQRDGAMAPWVMDLDGKEPPRKLEVAGVPAQVDVSPDGTSVALELAGAGIELVPLSGGPPRPLTTAAGDGKPRFTRDGRTVLFTRQPEGATPRVFSISIEGGEPRPHLEPATSDAAPSPVDDRVAYLAGTEADRLLPCVANLGRGARRPLSPALQPGGYRAVAVSPDGKRVAVLLGASKVVEVDASTGSVLRSVDSWTDSFVALSYLGDDPVVVRSQWIGDLWLAELAP